MPEKGRRETPLHLSVKIGAVEVVEALMSYPQCRMTANSDGLYPKDVRYNRHQFAQKLRFFCQQIICARLPNATNDIIQSIQSLLNETFYVPLLRSEDISCQPIIGEPFLATKLPVPMSVKTKVICYSISNIISDFQ
jgi:ankyrin repeat and LEM domain-containing protein 2